MGLLKWLMTKPAYEVTCRCCGRTAEDDKLPNAIKYLQYDNLGCGKGFHDPIITRQP